MDTHKQFARKLLRQGYQRVERDDRLLDVFPGQTREKGVELWEKWPRSAGQKSRSARWDTEQVEIIRLRLPFDESKVKSFTLPRHELETALILNMKLSLEK